MSKKERPLSPHLQIYKPQITSVLSILHRITGAGLALGAILISWWLFAILYGGKSYEYFLMFRFSFVGGLLIIGFLWAFIYHGLNGIRHLVWDTGHGVNIPAARKSGWQIVVASLVLTFLIWGMAGQNFDAMLPPAMEY